MPSRPKRPCRRPGCPELIEGGGYCQKHLAEQRAQYDKEQRPERHDFYRSASWLKVRAMVLAQFPACQICNRELANTVDHIKTLEERWDLRLTMDNLQSCCPSCHATKSAKERKQSGRW